jgi:hypothetical protein
LLIEGAPGVNAASGEMGAWGRQGKVENFDVRRDGRHAPRFARALPSRQESWKELLY